MGGGPVFASEEEQQRTRQRIKAMKCKAKSTDKEGCQVTSSLRVGLEDDEGIDNLESTIEEEPLRLLRHRTVPRNLVGSTFEDLLLSLLKNDGQLVLGLYRPESSTRSRAPYVATNPPRDLLVSSNDIIYIVA